MRIQSICQNTACRRRIESDPLQPNTFVCPVCGWPQTVRLANTYTSGVISVCPCCGGDELYVRKDFPQKVGLITVLIVAGASCYLFAKGQLLWALGILLVMVIIDFLIYLLVPRLTVCYRCRAEFRGVRINPEHHGFDLATAEKYR
jgi:predicted RNA-binding Zn-ribbon protein involved in translation (DUF1610 family)